MIISDRKFDERTAIFLITKKKELSDGTSDCEDRTQNWNI